MNITLIGSGTRNRMMCDFNGDIPWEKLQSYREFLLRHIRRQTVLIGSRTYERPFFKQLLQETQTFPIVIARDDHPHEDCIVCNASDEAVRIATDMHCQELFILGGESLFKEFAPRTERILYMEFDMNLRDGTHFPGIDDRFWKISVAPSREIQDDVTYRYDTREYRVMSERRRAIRNKVAA